MSKPSAINRRQLLGAGLALPFGAVAAKARAADAACAMTPRQTSGPFYPAYEQVDKDVDLTRVTGHDDRAEGEVIRVHGRVLDAGCQPVAGAIVEVWQANAKGRYAHPADPNPAPIDPNFQGWGQAVTDAEGRYSFLTIKPAPYPLEFLDGEVDERAGYRTPHIHFRVTRRGYLDLTTQMYFAGEPLNDVDLVLRHVPVADRGRVIIARGTAPAGDPPPFAFDLTIVRA
jgi:protocatechuate 3,4-dioxygenase beta subunit